MKLVSTTPSSTNTTTAIDTAIAIGIAAVADTVTAESIATIATAAIAAFVIVGIVFVAGTVVVGVVKRLVVVVERVGIEMRCLRAVHLTMLEMFLVYCPFSNNRPDVKPGSSFSFPSFFCGYPSRACFYIP